MEINNKKEIITLILADMKSRKLIVDLEAAGLSPKDFNTDLAELILSKLEIPKKNLVAINNWYEDTIFSILEIDLNKFRKNQLFLVDKFYYDLLQQKNQCRVRDTTKTKCSVYTIIKWPQFHIFDN